MRLVTYERKMEKKALKKAQTKGTTKNSLDSPSLITWQRNEGQSSFYVLLSFLHLFAKEVGELLMKYHGSLKVATYSIQAVRR